MRNALIELEGVGARIDDRAIFEGVSLRVEEGERVAVLGENGTGKSTLVELILGLRAPSAGSVRVLGAAPPAPRVAFVLQQPGETLLPWLTLGQSFALPLRVAGAGPRACEEAVRDARARLDPDGQLDPRVRPAKLSGGQRQLAALIQAAASRPRLLVCDEPMSAIDAEHRARLRRALRELCEAPGGPSLLFVTHDAEDVRALATRSTELPARCA